MQCHVGRLPKIQYVNQPVRAFLSPCFLLLDNSDFVILTDNESVLFVELLSTEPGRPLHLLLSPQSCLQQPQKRSRS